MSNYTPIASLCLQKNLHLSTLSNEKYHSFIMLGTIHKRIGIVEDLIPINEKFESILSTLSNGKPLSEKEDELMTNLIQNVFNSLEKNLILLGVVIKRLNDDDNFVPLDVKMIKNKLSIKDFSIVYLNSITLAKIYCASANFGDIFYYDELDLNDYHRDRLTININLNIKRIIYMKEIDSQSIASSIEKIISNCINESYIMIQDNKVKILIPRSLLVKEDLFGKKESFYKKVLINISSQISFTLSADDKQNKTDYIKKEIIERMKTDFDYDNIEVKKTSDANDITFEVKGRRYNRYVMNHNNIIMASSMNKDKFIIMIKQLFPSLTIIEKDGVNYIE